MYPVVYGLYMMQNYSRIKKNDLHENTSNVYIITVNFLSHILEKNEIRKYV